MTPGRPSGEQDSLSWQVKARTATHLPLEHRDPVDLALDRAGTPRHGQPGHDRVEVLAQPAGNESGSDTSQASASLARAEALHAPKEWPEYHAGHDGAFVRDHDGNNVEAVCCR